MLSKIVYSLFFFTFLFSLNNLFSQNKVAEIDKLKNDSVAILKYEEYIIKNKLSVKEKLNILLRISIRSCISRDFKRGVKSGNEGIVLAKNNKLDSMETVLTKMLGITYYFMEQRIKAINYFEKAIYMSHQNGDWFTEATC